MYPAEPMPRLNRKVRVRALQASVCGAEVDQGVMRQCHLWRLGCGGLVGLRHLLLAVAGAHAGGADFQHAVGRRDGGGASGRLGSL